VGQRPEDAAARKGDIRLGRRDIVGFNTNLTAAASSANVQTVPVIRGHIVNNKLQ
jgi:hypothetical protein